MIAVILTVVMALIQFLCNIVLILHGSIGVAFQSRNTNPWTFDRFDFNYSTHKVEIIESPLDSWGPSMVSQPMILMDFQVEMDFDSLKEGMLYAPATKASGDKGNITLLSEEGMMLYTPNPNQPLPKFFIIRDGEIHAVTGNMVQLPAEPPDEQ